MKMQDPMIKRFRNFHHIDQKSIDQMFDSYAPVFVLSTGRSGSKFIHHILSKTNSIASFHEPTPTLMYFSNFAFHNQHNKELLKAIFLSARMELILDAFNKNVTYFESNQCMVFFASVINDVFQNARFIHIVRHPGDFIRSAIMKGWHVNDTIWESGRVRIHEFEKWQKLHSIQKLAWVWKSTNEFINDFLYKLSAERFLTIRFEDMITQPEIIKRIFLFLGISETLKHDTITNFQKIKINKHKIGSYEPDNMKKLAYFPKYQNWSISDKEKLKKSIGNLYKYYNYNL